MRTWRRRAVSPRTTVRSCGCVTVFNARTWRLVVLRRCDAHAEAAPGAAGENREGAPASAATAR